ncbi:enoyl-CoA hydratase/isomerase family protein [Gordonia humi]|uniref:Enoyl-CoA hydratase/carnithine racemase n=1 Tax=Gordonia humi TaxID=686429 RepID=A0A840F242_9ACTN|nr:enoyl-CoA hydratase/isomerase family protein [Gordonia humi]MBB4133637.1 enoyl-CoA hydratase/carnithine racemase [Gordonia humi]
MIADPVSEPTVVDLDRCDEPPSPFDFYGPPVIGIATAAPAPGTAAHTWADRATVSITESPTDDVRIVHVDSIDMALADIRATIVANPIAAAVCDDVLRANSPGTDTRQGLTTESLGYSTLQAGPEFARWLAEQKPRTLHEQDDAVVLDRTGDTLTITFNRPDRHNAFSNALRAGLIDGLHAAIADPTITDIVFTGNGRSFCSGGDLREFGLFDDPSASHLARTRYSPAILLDAVRERLGTRLRADVHGAVLGSGLEMASYCGRVVARPDAVFGLPELGLGLIPGAGGTVSVPRRIGRWRTAYLAASNRQIDADTALAWGLVDEITSSDAAR